MTRSTALRFRREMHWANSRNICENTVQNNWDTKTRFDAQYRQWAYYWKAANPWRAKSEAAVNIDVKIALSVFAPIGLHNLDGNEIDLR